MCIFINLIWKTNHILSSTANATLHSILNNSLTIREIHSKFGMQFTKITSEGQSWELMPHVWHGGGFKRVPKSSFQRNSFQNDTHFNKLLYHWIANYYEKQGIHCPHTFSSIWLSCFCKVKRTGDSCNGIDCLVQWCRYLRNVPWMGNKSRPRFLAFLCKFRHFSVHKLTGQCSKSLIVYQVLKTYQQVHMQHGKSTFVLECEYLRILTWKPSWKLRGKK